MTSNDSQQRMGCRGRTWILVAVLLAGVLWCWRQSRALASLRDGYSVQVRQVREMRADAAQIQMLGSAPRIATERRKPNDELLAQIGRALQSAGIGTEQWVSSEPQSPVRIPDTPYQRFTLRITLADVSLRQLISFFSTLALHDPTLGIGGIRLTAPQEAGREWDADIMVEYLVYNPISP